MHALIGQEIEPFLTKPLQWLFFLLNILFLWIILTHIDDGISYSILASIFLHLLQMLWMSGWMQCPILGNEMSLLLEMSADLLHLLFKSHFLWLFPVCYHSLPASWNLMVIQTTYEQQLFLPFMHAYFSCLT